MVKRPCIDCGRLIASSTRCRVCRGTVERRRGSPTQRGYDSAWYRVVRAAINEQPWCANCMATHDLTGDHLVPLSLGGTSTPDNVVVLCRRCNSAKGARYAV